MLSRKFTWWCFGGFFKIFFREESLSVFESGGLEGGVHYRVKRDEKLFFIKPYTSKKDDQTGYGKN